MRDGAERVSSRLFTGSVGAGASCGSILVFYYYYYYSDLPGAFCVLAADAQRLDVVRGLGVRMLLARVNYEIKTDYTLVLDLFPSINDDPTGCATIQ